MKVAGKTGTAELRDTTNDDPDPDDPNAAAGRRTRPTRTRGSPPTRRCAGRASAVAVMLVGQGAGGETAAPVARQVLEAALKR